VKRFAVTLLAGSLSLGFLVPGLLLAQDPAKKKDEQPVLTAEQLAAQQKKVRQRLKKIHETMDRIANILAKTDPEKAGRLREALNRSLDDRNIDKIREIEDILKEEYFNPAADAQKDLEKALVRLLDILLDRDAERKDLQEKIKELESLKERLDNIIAEEKDHEAKSDKFANPEKTLQRARAAMAKLENLINRQNKQIGDTKKPFGDKQIDKLQARLGELRKKQAEMRGQKDAGMQKSLGQQAEQLAKDIAAMAKGLPADVKQAGPGGGSPAEQASKATGRAGESMKDAAAKMAGGSDSKGEQGSAEQDLREASDALKRLKERMRKSDQGDLAKQQERIKEDTARLQKEMERLEKTAPGKDSGSDDLGKAQGDMGKAGSQLGKGGASGKAKALPHEEEALKDLKRAYEKLKEFEKELKRLIKLPDYKKLADEQDDTTKKTKDLADKMKKAGEKKGGDGGEGGENEGTPGQGGVEGAKRAMDRAGKNLRRGSSGGANKDQKEAIERLEKAREELEEVLRQLREEEQLMLLDALERRLIKMLQVQRKLFKDTLALHDRVKSVQKAGKKPARADVDKARQIGDGEAGLAHEAEKILDILKEEGTTIVIPDVIDDTKGDLDTLAKRLRAVKAGQYTQQIQLDVIETLKELIQVIQQERERRDSQGQGQPGEPSEGDNPDSLLPTSAELKMLKALQLRVNRRTSRFDRLRVKENDERGHISDKQKSVGKLTRTMADKLNQEEE